MSEVTLRPLPSGALEARFAIYVGENYAGGVTVHSIDRENGVFSYGVAIAQSMRRRGVAFSAIDLLLARYRADGFSRCVVEIYADNAPSRALHEKLGFSKTAAFLKDGRETVRMARALC